MKLSIFTVLQKHGKLPYKAQLESSQVPFISVDNIQVLKKTATGPISGSVYEAIWIKPGGEEVGCVILQLQRIALLSCTLLVHVLNFTDP